MCGVASFGQKAFYEKQNHEIVLSALDLLKKTVDKNSFTELIESEQTSDNFFHWSSKWFSYLFTCSIKG